MKECELFEPVKKFLVEKVGCSDVYGEVADCDVFATCGKVNIVVELKTSLNFKVVEQAIRRRMYGHHVYVAVPWVREVSSLATTILDQYGIGLLLVDDRGYVTKRATPKLNRRVHPKIRDRIRPYHATQVGGVKGGEAETDYSVMIKNIKQFLRLERRNRTTNGWTSVEKILRHCETYYSNPKRSLMETLQKSWNNHWCESRIMDKKRYFRIKDDE